VKYAYYGDANLDGVVNTADFSAVAAGYNSAGVWSGGDFNYDGQINALDFNALVTNYGQAVTASSALGALAPEPSALALLGMSALAAMRRRKKFRNRAVSAGALLAMPLTAGASTVVNFHVANNAAAGPPTNANILYVGQGAATDTGNNFWNGMGPGFNAGANGANATSTGSSTPVTLTLSPNLGTNGGLNFDGPDAMGGNTHQGTPFFLLGHCTLTSSGNPGAGTTTAPMGTFTLNNVPTATYDVYLYGSNYDGDRGAIFSVSSGTADSGITGTVNQGQAANNTFTLGTNYVVFHNVTPSGGVISGSWIPNPASTLQGEGNFNAIQLVTPTNIVIEPEWGVNSAGNWNTASNWIGGVPNGVAAVARLLTKSTSAHTLFTDTPITLGTLRMENAATYVIGGNGNLTMQVAAGAGSISVSGAAHKINLALTFASSTNINVVSGGTLTIADPTTINANQTVAKTGTVKIEAPLTIQSGGALVNSGGGLTVFGAPNLGAGAKVDVGASSMIVRYGGLGSPAATIRTNLIAGRNGGAWNGAGITSSAAATVAIDGNNPHKTALGYAEASSIGLSTVDGIPIDPVSVVVRYTYSGDANLDGAVNTADFNALAAKFNQSGQEWVQGDFNYDGNVNALDFNAIATNFGSALPGSPVSGGALGALVPEPGVVGALATGAMLTARRRRA
jgi:hypothetical protein